MVSPEGSPYENIVDGADPIAFFERMVKLPSAMRAQELLQQAPIRLPAVDLRDRTAKRDIVRHQLDRSRNITAIICAKEKLPHDLEWCVHDFSLCSIGKGPTTDDGQRHALV